METQVIGIAALAIVLPAILGIIKHFMSKPSFSDIDRDMVTGLYKMHNVLDAEGRPIWYNSINQHEHNMRTIELIRDILYTQQQVVAQMEKLVDKIDRKDR